AVLARDKVGRVPPRPVMLRSGWFVFAMMLLRFSQKLRQCRDAHGAESSPGKPRRDFLKQPAVAVRVAERGERTISGVIGRRSTDSTARAVRLELRSGCFGVEHLADLDTAGGEFAARSLDVGDDEVVALRRAGCHRRHLGAELDGAPEAGGGDWDT